MSDPIADLQAKLKGSSDPVSCFFLIRVPTDAARMLEKVQLLSAKGVTADYLETIRHFMTQALMNESPEANFQHSLLFFFQPDGEARRFPATMSIRGKPGEGFEVEVVMPGVLAAGVPEFFENGFWTAFMPPSFYD